MRSASRPDIDVFIVNKKAQRGTDRPAAAYFPHLCFPGSKSYQCKGYDTAITNEMVGVDAGEDIVEFLRGSPPESLALKSTGGQYIVSKRSIWACLRAAGWIEPLENASRKAYNSPKHTH